MLVTPESGIGKSPVSPGVSRISRFGRESGSGNPQFPDSAGNRESGSRGGGPGSSWSGRRHPATRSGRRITRSAESRGARRLRLRRSARPPSQYGGVLFGGCSGPRQGHQSYPSFSCLSSAARSPTLAGSIALSIMTESCCVRVLRPAGFAAGTAAHQCSTLLC
jgi:hypothetical protein